MTEQTLTVSRGVIAEMARLAAFEVPGVQHVGRAGPPWRRLFLGPAVSARVRDGRVSVRVAIVARPGQALGPLAGQVRSAVGAAVERLLGLELEGVTVLVDGVGG
ncbi:MAG TPA: Asp23/Gls24 family envelope stress response protein [Candidatus Limnocylindrales bacterium]|nr:Asp23/Gls24 family envelope stress response protein [Candidatus Limnocylindrales bacterium]